MDWTTTLISIISSTIFASTVTALINYKTQINTIKESGLYAKRAEVLDIMMKKIENLDRSTNKLVSPFQDKTTDQAEIIRRKESSESFNSFVYYYSENRHYLSKKLSDKIEKFHKDYHDIFTKFCYKARIIGEKPNIKEWQELVKKHSIELSEQKECITKEFRKIIGVK
ncbi:hypothetical protein KAI92_05350 [Candidatus Parcubacteria bacterium]|nr:hypothetical protein [Candidatus Parcubacteria bacterium]